MTKSPLIWHYLPFKIQVLQDFSSHRFVKKNWKGGVGMILNLGGLKVKILIETYVKIDVELVFFTCSPHQGLNYTKIWKIFPNIFDVTQTFC